MGLLRKIRGALGTGIVWAVAWVLGTLALLGVSVLIPGGSPQMWSLPSPQDRGGCDDRLHQRRPVPWGVTGAPVSVGALVLSLVTGGGLGMATAAGSVRIAKSAAAKELLEG